jgi:type II secretory pathway predicted ATPase ExeA
MNTTDSQAEPLFQQAPPDPDKPIVEHAEDRLRRAAFADALAGQIAAAGQDGLVMAVTGPWGSGKTSLLNLIHESLGQTDAVVVRFNPWFFSGTESLIRHFFDELGAQLAEKGDELRELGAQLRRYGAILSPLRFIPVAGEWIDKASELTQALGGALSGENRSLLEVRKDLSERLVRAERRVVVMVDDIDRLTDDEIRQVMRLVRLVGDFPNVVYLLAFDAGHVADVLSNGDREDGRRYLEKIVQLAYEVPAIGRTELNGLLAQEIERSLAALPAPVPARDFSDVIDGVIAPLVLNVRDVRRYANVLPFALHLLADEVNPVDILALEAIRLFLPSVHERLPGLADLLTGVIEVPEDEGSQQALDDRLESLVVAAGPKDSVLEALFELVFPSAEALLAGESVERERAKSWRRDRRVASRAIFKIYWEKGLPGNVVPTAVVNELVDALATKQPAVPLLEAMPDQQIRDAMSRLPDTIAARRSTGELSQEALVEGAADWLAAVLARSKADTGFTTSTLSSIHLREVITGTLLSIDDERDRCEVARQLLERTEDLLSQLRIVQTLDARRRRAAPPLPIDCLAELQKSVKDTILGRDPGSMRQQDGLADLLGWVISIDQTAIAQVRRLLDDDDVLVQYLRTVRPMPRRRLPDILGSEDELQNRLERLRGRAGAEPLVAEAFEAVDRLRATIARTEAQALERAEARLE